MATRGQVKRALDWIEWTATPQRARLKLVPPKCVTCGSAPTGITRGEPAYRCRHDPFRLDDETIERARKDLGA